MKRILALILIAMLSVTGLVSCGSEQSGNDGADASASTPENSGGNSGSDIPADPTDTRYTDSFDVPSELDYDGYEFRILTAGNVAYDDFSFSESTEVVLDNAQYERKLRVETDLGVSIELDIAENKSSFGDGPGFKKIFSAVSTNDQVYDMGLIGTYDVTQLAISRSLYDMNRMDYINLKNSWWDQDANNDLAINGMMFFTTGDITVSNNNQTFCLIFNKKLAELEKIKDPYQLVKDGVWTYDELQVMVKTVTEDVNGDDKMDMRDKYGMIVWDDSVMAAVNSAGQRCCTIDEQGSIKLTLNTETTVNVLNEWFEMTYDKNTAIYNQRHTASNATNGNAMKMWQEDRALFRNFLINDVHALRAVESDFGILPYPKLNTEQTRYYSTLAPYNGQFICIPLIQDDLTRTGAITEALAYHGQQIVRPAFYEKTLYGGVIRDEESGDMLDIMLKSYIYDFGWYYRIGKYNSTLIYMVREYSTDFASNYAAAEESALTQITTINEEFAELSSGWEDLVN